jgi:hypothetical protein
MRGLIEQERDSYNEERLKFESDIQMIESNYDNKGKHIRKKISMVLP